MGLADRLRAAEQERQERLRAAGMSLLVDLTTEPEPEERAAADSSELIIDLRTPAPEAETPPAESAVECPICGGPTRLDLEDVIGGSCLVCGHLFEVTH